MVGVSADAAGEGGALQLVWQRVRQLPCQQPQQLAWQPMWQFPRQVVWQLPRRLLRQLVRQLRRQLLWSRASKLRAGTRRLRARVLPELRTSAD